MSSLFRNDFSSRLNAENLVRKTRVDASANVALRFFGPSETGLAGIYGANLRRWYGSDSIFGATWQDLAGQKDAYTGIGGAIFAPSSTTINSHLAPNFNSGNPNGFVAGDGYIAGVGYNTLQPLVFVDQGIWGAVIKTSSLPADAVYGGTIIGQWYNGGEFLLGVQGTSGLLIAWVNGGPGAVSNAAINDGNVHTCYATWDGTTVTLYVDGVAQTSTQTTNSAPPIVYTTGDDVNLGCGTVGSGNAPFAMYDGQMGEVFAANVFPTSAQLTATQAYLHGWATGAIKTASGSVTGVASAAIASDIHIKTGTSIAGAAAASIASDVHIKTGVSATGVATVVLARTQHIAAAVSIAGAAAATISGDVHKVTGISATGAAVVAFARTQHIAASTSATGAATVVFARTQHIKTGVTCTGAASVSVSAHKIATLAVTGVAAASIASDIHIKTGTAITGAAAVSVSAHKVATLAITGAASVVFARTQHIVGGLAVTGAAGYSITGTKIGIKTASGSATGAAVIVFSRTQHIKPGGTFTGAAAASASAHKVASLSATGAALYVIHNVHRAAATGVVGAAGATCMAGKIFAFAPGKISASVNPRATLTCTVYPRATCTAKVTPRAIITAKAG